MSTTDFDSTSPVIQVIDVTTPIHRTHGVVTGGGVGERVDLNVQRSPSVKVVNMARCTPIENRAQMVVQELSAPWKVFHVQTLATGVARRILCFFVPRQYSK